MTDHFRFDALLKVRASQRDTCLRILTEEVVRRNILQATRDAVLREQLEVQEELRSIQSPQDHQSGWSVGRVISRQHQLQQLKLRLQEVDLDIEETEVRLSILRRELQAADASVKGLEKLSERHDNQQRVRARHLEEQELADRRFLRRAS